jgi:hypothetical protein
MEPLYMLKVVCAKGCSREALGPARKASEGEFPDSVVEQFYRDLEAVGWTRYEFETGFKWLCNRPDCKPFEEQVKERIQECLENMTPERRERLRNFKPIRPDWFKTVTIKNLEDE